MPGPHRIPCPVLRLRSATCFVLCCVLCVLVWQRIASAALMWSRSEADLSDAAAAAALSNEHTRGSKRPRGKTAAADAGDGRVPEGYSNPVSLTAEESAVLDVLINFKFAESQGLQQTTKAVERDVMKLEVDGGAAMCTLPV